MTKDCRPGMASSDQRIITKLEASDTYVLWDDPDFLSFCSILADTCQRMMLDDLQLPAPSHSATSENQW